MEQPSAKAPIHPVTGWVILIVWAAAVSLPLAYLTGFHLLPVPGPATSHLQVPLDGTDSSGEWRAYHVLVADCGCSQQIAEHLLHRGTASGLRETVWLIGEDPALASALREAGFSVEQKAAETLLVKYQIQGGPWLFLQTPRGEIAYSGGYGPRPVGGNRDIRDVELWNALRQGEHPSSYPAFGCAAAASLIQTLDPLNLKGRSTPAPIQ